MTAEVEFGTTGDPATPSSAAPVRTPAMRAYCATLARFTSSVQSTEQLLRNDDAGTREDAEQREQTAATRLRGIHRASSAADDGLAHCATVRSEYGLTPLLGGRGPGPATAGPLARHPHPDHAPGAAPAADQPSAHDLHPDYAAAAAPATDNPLARHSHPDYAPGAAPATADQPPARHPHLGHAPGAAPATDQPLTHHPRPGQAPGPAIGDDPFAGHVPTAHPDDHRSFDAAGQRSWPIADPGQGSSAATADHHLPADQPPSSYRRPSQAPGPAIADDPFAAPHPDDHRPIDAAGQLWSPAADPGQGSFAATAHHYPPADQPPSSQRSPRTGADPHQRPPTDWTYDAPPYADPAGRRAVDPVFHGDQPSTGYGHAGTADADHGSSASTAGHRSPRAGTDPDHVPPTGHRPSVDDTSGFDAGYGPADHTYANRPASPSRAAPTGGAATAVHADPVVRPTAHELDDPTPAVDRLRRTGGADLGVALTALGRRRDELKLAEAEFETWLVAHDEQSRRVTTSAAVGAGLAGAAVMVIAGTRVSAAMTLALLIACTLAVVAVGLGVAAARRLPRVCRGAGLSRRPDTTALVRYGARIGGAALLALTVANIAAGAL
ncbi:hypothetical protein [Jiangella sp. DSM 45060]|uniref:hypothetical protein n=1 Tax=Jiangella sp. DSM 45060 TaxID=1798224 RepID=UPI00087A6E61|nr:hypothetical protein [Jiangella sp. DSM 45060]SDT68603.1 hypothetical protein SAMN04515669_5895 [Jiangella sp. DSM 45060]